MLRISGSKESFRVAQLVNCLPQEPQQLITGMSCKEQAWEELDAKYGNRGIMILRTMSKLIQLVLLAGTAYDKIEALVNDIRTVNSCMKAVGAEDKMFASCFTVEILTSILEDSTQYSKFQ